MNKRLNLQVLKYFSLILLLTSCLGDLRSQNPRDTFVSEKFPRQLELIRSQMREITQTMRDQILKRVENDKTRTDLIRVAVIDSGTDIAHKDLYGQIDYKVENGRIVGAGIDIMGKSPFASHVFVNPTMYAFTPHPLKNGRIDKHPENPLKDLKDINDRFMDILLKGIQADPDLKSGFYSRLNRSNINILGFEKFYDKSREAILAEMKPDGHTPIDPNKPKNKKEREEVERLKAENWIMNYDDAPLALYSLSRFTHYEKFADLVASSLKAVDAEFSFYTRVRNLNIFINPKVNSYDTLKVHEIYTENINTDDTLKNAMSFVQFGFDAYDPILNLENFFKNHPEYKKMSFEVAIRTHIQKMRDYLTRISQETAVNADNKKLFAKAEKEFSKLENMIINILAVRNNPSEYRKMRSQLRRYIIRNHHPYISPASANNDHGTHVAGIVARQDDRIRIVPIRVNTQGLMGNGSLISQKESAELLLKRFEKFKETPFFEALLAQIAQEYDTKITTSRISTEVKKYMKNNAFEAQFIEEVFDAIRTAGNQEIKLANVSLGTSFNKEHDGTNKPAAIAVDLLAEMFRYEMGREIETHAPKTLFVVATGNNGDWIDGISRTNFPVGITSLRLIEIAKKLKLPATPNNRTKNVIAVGSVSTNGNLTQFSNIFIDPNIPVIFSTGEAVMSSVPGKSESLADNLTEEEFKNLAPILKEIDDFREFEADSSVENEDKQNKLSLSRSNDSGLEDVVKDSLKRMIFFQGKVERAKMSGTSMSTPTVTGLIAKYILMKMKQLGISNNTVYKHADFSPEKLIEEINQLAKDKKVGILTMKTLTEKIATWKASENESKVMNFPKRIAKPACSYIFSKAN